jgi:segregation and condensation protein B
VEAIRGVSADYAIQKLLEKELIVISGRNETMPGHPLVYATSKSFMDYFGINSPEDLPKIKEVLAEQIIEPTIVSETDFMSEAVNTEPPPAIPPEDAVNLSVTEDGELIENKDQADGEES